MSNCVILRIYQFHKDNEAYIEAKMFFPNYTSKEYSQEEIKEMTKDADPNSPSAKKEAILKYHIDNGYIPRGQPRDMGRYKFTDYTLGLPLKSPEQCGKKEPDTEE